MPVSPVTARPGAGVRLAELIRCRTVSAWHTEPDRAGVVESFTEFPGLLDRLYPLLHGHLEREWVDGTGLLFRWRGDPFAGTEPWLVLDDGGAAGRALPWITRSGTAAARALASLDGEAATMVRTTVARTRLRACA